MIALETSPREQAAVVALLLILCFVDARAMTPGSELLATVGGLILLAAWAAVVPAVFGVLDRMLKDGSRPMIQRIVGVLAVVATGGAAQGALTLLLEAGVARVVDGLHANITGSNGLAPSIVRATGQSLVYLLAPYLAIRGFHHFRRRERERWERDQAVRIAQLQALSAELQPHFLFNTLNAVAGLVRSDPRAAETMLVRLSDLLRLTLGLAGARESSLGSEVARLEHYVALQQMRFGSRLTVRLEVPAEVRGAVIPGLLLQPLVENALVHGLNPKNGPGTIVVTAARQRNRLLLTVTDDGVGLAPPGSRQERLGVGNTRARLAARFPGDFRFELAPGPAGGTVASIDVPFLEASSDPSHHR